MASPSESEAASRACLPSMERGSHIIEVASAAAFMPLPYMNVYALLPASAGLRLASKVVPNAVIMAAWDIMRKL